MAFPNHLTAIFKEAEKVKLVLLKISLRFLIVPDVKVMIFRSLLWKIKLS